METNIIQKEFNRNIFEFDTVGKQYFFLASKNYIFEHSAETKEIFNSIKSSPSTIVTHNYVSKSAGVSTKHAQRSIKKLNHSFSEKKPSKNTIKIDFLTIMLTGHCNLNCNFCLQKDFPVIKEKMKSAFVEKALASLVKNKKIFHIRFYGGEPLVEFELIKKIVRHCEKYFKNTSFNFSIFTNGTLLNSEIINFFKLKKFTVSLSLNGNLDMIRKTQTNFNANFFGNFEKNIKKLTSSLTPASVNSHTVITKDNIDIFALFPYLLSLGFKNFNFSPLTTKNKSTDLSLINSWIKNRDAFFENNNNSFLPNSIKYFNTLIDNRAILKNFCDAGKKSLFLSNSGDFYICHRLLKNKVGSVKEGIDVSYLKKLTSYFPQQKTNSKCYSCWARNLCAGGCIARNISSNNNFHLPNENYCKLILSTIILALKIYVKKQKNGRTYDGFNQTN